MILSLIAVAIMNVLGFFLGLLPVPETLPTEIDDAFTLFATYYPKINYMFPLDTLFVILGLIATIELGFLTFKIFNYILRAVHVIG